MYKQEPFKYGLSVRVLALLCVAEEGWGERRREGGITWVDVFPQTMRRAGCRWR